jgi:arsenate reductase
VVHPAALKLLQQRGHAIEGLRSKSWDEFGAGHQTQLDFIVTVCDDAAGEVCPIWPGKPIRAHWGIPDPAAVHGSDEIVDGAFAETYRQLRNHIELFAGQPIDTLDSIAIKRRMDEIHKTQNAQESV